MDWPVTWCVRYQDMARRRAILDAAAATATSAADDEQNEKKTDISDPADQP